MMAALVRGTLRALDALTSRLPLRAAAPQAPHLATGRRGEEDAYFYLRRQGYVMVARNWRSPRRHGEIDLIGWEGETLCFIEVKTRTRRDFNPAEAAVDQEKQADLRRVAAEYLRRSKRSPAARFDIVSVYYESASPQFTLFRNAFPLA